mgnify:CR=1 FL=1
MKYSDFYHIPVAGDGACFFHSISGINHLNEHLWPISKSKPITYKIESSKWDASSMKLRKQCVEWLEKNLDYRIKGIGMTIRDEILEDVQMNDDIKDKTVKGYLSYMKKRNSYAGQIEIYAIAELLNKNIRTYISKDNNLSNVGLGYELKPKDSQFDIFLYHNLGDIGNDEGGHHFEILYPKKKAQIVKKGQYMKEVTKGLSKLRRSVKRKRSVNKKRSVKRKRTQRRKK